jgi:ferredoxin
MRVTIDSAACTGHAQCMMRAPGVYVLDDAGYNAMGSFIVAPGLESQAETGMSACPEKAITIS